MGAPIVIVVLVSCTSANYMLLPPPGLSLKWYAEVLSLSWFRTALTTSLVVALVSTVVATVMGILVARALARPRFAGRALVDSGVFSPLILPGVVLGLAPFSGFASFDLIRVVQGDCASASLSLDRWRSIT